MIFPLASHTGANTQTTQKQNKKVLSRYIKALCTKSKIRWWYNRLTVVCMQYIFTLCTANSIFRFAHVSSNVAVGMVTYQKLPSLFIWMKEESIQCKYITQIQHRECEWLIIERPFCPLGGFLTMRCSGWYCTSLSAPCVSERRGSLGGFAAEGDCAASLLATFHPTLWLWWGN